MPIDWRTLGPILGGAGASILGGYLQNRSANQGQEYERDIYERELARRNQMQGMIAPSLLQAVGYRNPQQIGRMTGQISGQPGGPMLGASGSPAMVPPTSSSASAKVLGGISAGAGAAGLLGMGSALGPIGLAAGGLALGASQIGKGRRTADVGVKAIENPLGAKLAAISAGQGGLPELQQAVAEYNQNIQAWRAMGGNHKKVAEQSLNNRALQDTIDRLYAQLGGVR